MVAISGKDVATPRRTIPRKCLAERRPPPGCVSVVGQSRARDPDQQGRGPKDAEVRPDRKRTKIDRPHDGVGESRRRRMDDERPQPAHKSAEGAAVEERMREELHRRVRALGKPRPTGKRRDHVKVHDPQHCAKHHPAERERRIGCCG